MNKKFNQTEYQAEWDKKNMMYVNTKFRRDFVLEFKTACKKLGITQSEVIRKAMEETIKKAEEQ